MPAKTKKQQRLMCAVAHDPKVAKKLGISQAVGKEFCTKVAASKKGK